MKMKKSRMKMKMKKSRMKMKMKMKKSRMKMKKSRMKMKKFKMIGNISCDDDYDTIIKRFNHLKKTTDNFDIKKHPLYIVNKDDPNLNQIRSDIKCLFVNTINPKSEYLGKGTFSTIYYNKTEFPEWVFRCTKVPTKNVSDELKITKLMLNNIDKKNLTDFWTEPSTDRGYTLIHSITRKFASDSLKFFPNAYKNYIILNNFYEGLYQQFEKLSKGGWICYDLKPQNVLIDVPSEHNTEWVKITDFGADWCSAISTLDGLFTIDEIPLIMMYVFQFNSINYLPNSIMREYYERFNEVINANIQKNPYLMANKDMVFQKLYNYFLYNIIVPSKIPNDPIKNNSMQTNLLHYSCGGSYNISITNNSVKNCSIFSNLRKYFSSRSIDNHKDIIDGYEWIVNRLNTNKQRYDTEARDHLYNELISSAVDEVANGTYNGSVGDYIQINIRKYILETTKNYIQHKYNGDYMTNIDLFNELYNIKR
jgi:hypothetical protein